MAEVKDKIVTVDSLKSKHDYDENTYLKKSDAEDIYLKQDDAEDIYLKRNGGSVFGDITFENGAKIISTDNFLLRASNGTTSTNLIGSHDGSLTWGDNSVLTSASVTPCCTFSGEDSSQLMTVGELTRAKLTTFLVNTDVGHFVESDNGIKILQTGYYQISGSAYILQRVKRKYTLPKKQVK